ncbi:MAG TPA: hypothetical protein DEP20_01345 [Fusobacteria bacterium]|nr:hypothetical protein [Fusobacteriota bacterium]
MFYRLSLLFFKSNLRSAVISILGVGISVSVLLCSVGIANGLSENTVQSMLLVSPHIKLESAFGAIKKYEKEIDKILKIEGVALVYPKIVGKGIAKIRTFEGVYSEGVVIEGIQKEDLEKIQFQDNLIKGEINFFEEGLFVGEEILKSVCVDIGDRVNLISHEGKKISLRISGVFNTGFYEYDSNVILIPFNRAKEIFGTDAATEIDVRVNDIYSAEKIAKEINRDTFLISKSWMKLNKKLLQGVSLEKGIMFIMLSFLLIVSSFIIFSSIYGIVMDSFREIGILRAIGFSRIKIFLSFLCLSGLYSLFGIMFGIVVMLFFRYSLGYFDVAILNEVYYLPEKIPFIISYREILGISLLANISAMISSIFPSLKASSIDPVKAIKYE